MQYTMPFLMLWERHKMANQSAPWGTGGVNRHSSGVKHFLNGV